MLNKTVVISKGDTKELTRGYRVFTFVLRKSYQPHILAKVTEPWRLLP